MSAFAYVVHDTTDEGFGIIKMDKAAGRVYCASFDGGTVSPPRWLNIRSNGKGLPYVTRRKTDGVRMNYFLSEFKRVKQV